MLSVILLAAGKSRRMQGQDKLKIKIDGLPVLAYSLMLFENSPICDELIVVGEEDYCRDLALKYAPRKFKTCVCGGKSRAESVLCGLKEAEGEFVCIHDGARPNLSAALLQKIFAAACRYGAAVPALPVTDTVKKKKDGKIISTLNREELCLTQTPQIFRTQWLKKAYMQENFSACTDDAELIQKAGYDVFTVEGEKSNIKLTVPEDVALLKIFMELNSGIDMDKSRKIRIGNGYDAHRLQEGRKLILGGVDIPFAKGLAGHSDADVLLHAVCDSLLGAAALGDIGKFFPDSNQKYKDISSLILLSETGRILKENGFSVQNIDATVIAQNPRLAPFIGQMRENIASSLAIDKENVCVKATTTEGMGFIGSGEGIAAMSVCSVFKY